MATTLKLTWDKSTKRWVKVYKGRKLYLGNGKRKDDVKSYLAALDEFARLKAEIDEQAEGSKPHYAEYTKAVDLRREMLAWLEEERARWSAHDLETSVQEDEYNRYRPHDQEQSKTTNAMPSATFKLDWVHPYLSYPRVHFLTCSEEHDRLTKENERLNQDAARTKPPALDVAGALTVDPLVYKTDWERQRWESRVEALRTFRRWTAAGNYAETVGANLDEYLEGKRAKARRGDKVSPAWVAVLEARLGHFRVFCGQLAVSQINGKTLTGFHANLVEKIDAGKLKAVTAAGILGAAKAFVKWLWESEITETLPRNLRTLNIGIGTTAVKKLPTEEVKALLSGASGRTKLFLLLMLNCGMTQQDISELRQTEVDWENGIVTRKRSKTRAAENVPTVAYKLWPMTFNLLKQFRSDDPDRVLVNQRGGPLRQREFKADGKTARNIDNIRSAYHRLCQRLKPDGTERHLKLLRKTAASALEDHATYGRYAQFFLGHAPQSVADRHYIVPSQGLFDAAVLWLGERFGVMQGTTARVTTA
jgi:integrase